MVLEFRAPSAISFRLSKIWSSVEDLDSYKHCKNNILAC